MQNSRPLTPREKKYQQAQRRRKMQLRFFGASFVVILLLSGVITALIELPGQIKANKEAAQSQNSEPAGSGSTAVVSGTLGPVQATKLQYTAPTASMLALPANGRVDMAYFQDALFIGDSITQGFQIYASGISNAHYAAYVGVGPKQLIDGTVTNLKGETVSAIDEILAAAPKKVYILLGTNSLSSLKDDAFLKYYNDFLDFLAPKLPADTVYYLQAIPPVTAEKAEKDTEYASSRIIVLNEAIAQMAYARGWHYLDLYSTLADDAGNLRADMVAGSNGVHLNGTGYEAWKDFLVTHSAYSAQSPYIPGSPYLHITA